MTSSYTQNRNFEQPANGDYVDTWNVPVNADWAAIDACLGSVVSVALSSSNVLLTTTQLQCFYLKFTGTISADITVTIPTGVGGLFQVENNTTGAFTVTLVSAGAGQSIVLPNASPLLISCDTTDVIGAGGVPSGAVMIFVMASAPAGWTQVETWNDATIRIVSGAGAVLNGTVGLSSFISGGTGDHTLVLAEAPQGQFTFNDIAHTHSIATGRLAGSLSGSLGGGSQSAPVSLQAVVLNPSLSNCSITDHAGGGAHNHPLQNLMYLDSIVCSKN